MSARTTSDGGLDDDRDVNDEEPAGVYIPPVHLTSHKARATKSTSRRRGGDAGSSPGLGHLTLLSHSNKPTAHGQRELSLCVPARGSTGGEDVDQRPRMETTHEIGQSSTAHSAQGGGAE